MIGWNQTPSRAEPSWLLAARKHSAFLRVLVFHNTAVVVTSMGTQRVQKYLCVCIPELSRATRVTSAGNHVSAHIFFLLSYKGKMSAVFLKATCTDDFASKKFGSDKQICPSQGRWPILIPNVVDVFSFFNYNPDFTLSVWVVRTEIRRGR